MPRDNQLRLFSLTACVLGPETDAEPVRQAHEDHEVGPSGASEDVTDSRVIHPRELCDGAQTLAADGASEPRRYLLRGTGGRLIDVTLGPRPTYDVSNRRTTEPSSLCHSSNIGPGFHSSDSLLSWWTNPPRVVESRPETLRRKLSTYTPARIPSKQWIRIKTFVGELVLASAPTKYGAGELASVISQHVAWCDVIAYELTPKVILNRDVIEQFIAEGCVGLGDGTRSNYRSILFAVAEAVLPPTEVLRRGTPIKASAPSAPYTQTEITALLHSAQSQRTPRQRHGALTLLAAGLGAGLGAEDLLVVRGSDVVTTERTTRVRVQGRRPRKVIVLTHWADRLQVLADTVEGGWLFLPNRQSTRYKATANFIKSLSTGGDTPSFSTQRLRATWICHHLSAGTPLPNLVEAAGVTTLHPFARYLQFLPLIDTAESEPWFRGERGK